MALITQIADAVADELNAGSFSQAFDAERLYQPIFELPDMKVLHVTVVPASLEMRASGRSAVQHDVGIDVAVQKKFQTGQPVELDPLMALTEEIIDLFRLRRLDGSDAVCVRAANEPIYSQEHMEQFRQFTSVVTLTFRIIR